MTEQLESIFSAVQGAPRLLIEADLWPVEGWRFQPTGFPDLGPATYKRADGTPMLLVESAQSMANRMEAVCWDDAENAIATPLQGLPHVIADLGSGVTTSSVQEAHRLNSPYIIKDQSLRDAIVAEVGAPDSGPLDIRKLAKAVFKRDTGAVIHGVFLEKVAGRLRLMRLLSGFVEAAGAIPVASGGVKLDRIDPAGNAAEGYGNVLFSRTEFTAQSITAFFNVDLALMRGYGLGDAANRLLVGLSLYKVLRVLETGLRLRTACDLDVRSITARRPGGIDLSQWGDLVREIETSLPKLIKACGFGDDPVTRVSGKVPPRKKRSGEAAVRAGGEREAMGGAGE